MSDSQTSIVENPPAGWPRVCPYLLYEDCATMLDWLSGAFGFVERERLVDAAGDVNHAELWADDAVVLLGDPGPDYRNPKRSGVCSSMIYMYVDDVYAHHDRAVAAGAVIVEAPTDQAYGDRRYMAEDPEGHKWAFAQHVRNI